MAYTMKGSPFQRNFGIGSPAKQDKDWFAPDTRTDAQKRQDKIDFETVHGDEDEFDRAQEEDDKKKLAEYNAAQAKKDAARKSDTPQ